MDEEKALITPETGLTAQQVQEHLEAGLGAGLPADSGRSEKEIIREDAGHAKLATQNSHFLSHDIPR